VSRTFLTGGTPLDPDESEGLIPSHVSTQAELNRVEQANILEAVTWATSRKHSRLLTDEFIRELHRRMFKDVWKWAGLYRRTLKNFGVPPETIPVEVKKLCEDTHYWVQNKVFPWDELAARFHHRLVAIHPFPNGNGRHARLLTDLLLRQQDQKPFSWGARTGQGVIGSDGMTRERYIEALRSADRQDFGPLLDFVRS